MNNGKTYTAYLKLKIQYLQITNNRFIKIKSLKCLQKKYVKFEMQILNQW